MTDQALTTVMVEDRLWSDDRYPLEGSRSIALWESSEYPTCVARRSTLLVGHDSHDSHDSHGPVTHPHPGLPLEGEGGSGLPEK